MLECVLPENQGVLMSGIGIITISRCSIVLYSIVEVRATDEVHAGSHLEII